MRIWLLYIVLLCSTWRMQAIEAYVFNGAGQSAENKLIALTVAGIVNREAPRLYLRNVYETWSYADTDEQWESIYAAQGAVQFTLITDINQLVQTFKPFIKGAIRYDASLTYGNFSGQSFRWQAEAATMLGGLTDCIPLPSTNTSIDINRPTLIDVPDYFNGQATIQVSAQLDLASHSWNNASDSQEQRYFLWLDWALDNLLPRSNTSKFYLREITDWAVNQRMFQLNLAGTEDLRFTSLSDVKAAKIERVMNYLKSKRANEIFHVYGWMRPEPLVQWISAYGGSFHETLLSNLSWHHVFPADIAFNYHQRPVLANASDWKLENKHYVLFVSSEGDAGNWVIGHQGGAWQSATRGQVPMGWGISLQMLHEFPFVAQHYFRTATANDGFVAVSTPLGYAYPDVFPSAFMPDAEAKTKALMQKFRVNTVYAYKHYNGAGTSQYRGVTISNNFDFAKLGSFAQQSNAALTMLYDPGLQTQRAYTNYGGLLFNHVNDDTFYANVSNLTATRDRIVAKLTNKTKPGFLLAGYQRFRHDQANLSSSTHDITLPRLKQLMDDLKNSSIGADIEFVTPEKYAFLLRKSLDLSTDVPNNDLVKPSLKISSVAHNVINIHLQLSHAQLVDVKLYDTMGRCVRRNLWQMSADADQTTMAVSEPGVYIVQLQGATVNLTTKIVTTN